MSRFTLHFIASLFIVILFMPKMADAFNLHMPQDMNAADRQQSLDIVGFGASGKLMSDPYPLGGYSGVEVGFSTEYLPTQNFNNLGNQQTSYPGEISYEELTLGKGLYHNLDLFLSITPWGLSSGISDYGGMIRWGFYEAKFFPLSCSLLLHGNVTNVHDDFISRALGAELMAAVNLDWFAIYFGGGQVQVQGHFSQDLTDSGSSVDQTGVSDHAFLGVSVLLGRIFFVAAQVDRYTDYVYGAKFGIRY